MKLVALNAEERSRLIERGKAWNGGWMTPDQFMARTERLYAHPYGACMHSFGWKDGEGNIVSSMERMEVTLLVRNKKGELREKEAGLIASVVTPDLHRGKNYASDMLTSFFTKYPKTPFVLYSDIGPQFYERFDFVGYPVTQLEGKSEKAKIEGVRPLPMAKFVALLREHRRSFLEKQTAPAATLFPDERFVDWHLERFRFFAEQARCRMPDTFFREAIHPTGRHLLATFPNFLNLKLYVMWGEPDCRECQVLCGAIAASWDLPEYVYWDRRPDLIGGKPEYPMIRHPGLGVAYTDLQLIDWW